MAAPQPPVRSPSPSIHDGCPSAPTAVLTEAADEIEMPLPSDPQTFFLGGLFVFAVFAALYVASSVILPVVLAFVLNLLLQPAVRLMERVHLPRAGWSPLGHPAGYRNEPAVSPPSENRLLRFAFFPAPSLRSRVM